MPTDKALPPLPNQRYPERRHDTSTHRFGSPRVSTHKDGSTTVHCQSLLPSDGAVVTSADGAEHYTHDHGWRPLFLRRPLILVFAIVFAVLAIVAGVLYHVSQANNGLSSTSSNYHYLWTYGPTALFLVLDAIWYQVDYATRAAMPWLAMSRLASAGDSVLADYLSVPPFIALFVSLKRRHFLVSVSISVALILKLLAVLSTGFFALNLKVPVPEPIGLARTSSFDAAAYLNGTQQAVILPYEAIYAWEKLDIPLTNWTSMDATVESFGLPNGLEGANSSLAASVDVFEASLGSCEQVVAQYDPTDIGQDGLYTMYVNTSACNATTNGFGAAATGYTLAGNLARLSCPNSTSYLPQLFLYWANVSNVEQGGDNGPLMVINQQSSFVCSPSYCVYNALVTTSSDGSDFTVTQPSHRDCRQLDGFSTTNLTDLIQASLNQGNYGSEGNIIWPDTPAPAADSFTYLARIQKETPVQDARQFLDPGKFIDATRVVFSGLGSAAASLYLSHATNDSLQGTLTLPKDRLVVTTLSFGLVTGFLLVNATLVVVLMLLVPPHEPCASASIGSVASVLADSQFVRRFSTKPLWKKSDIERESARALFIARVGDNDGANGLRIDHVPSKQDQSPGKSRGKKETKWWTPPAATLAYGLLQVLLLIAMIIALEIIYEKSSKNNGLGDVNPEEGARFAWTYVPALLTTLATILVQGLNTTVKILEPYSLLKKGHAGPSRTFFADYLKESAFTLLPRSLTRKRFAVFASTLALSLGPVLTVAVGGLYSPQSVPYVSVVDLHTNRTFNISHFNDWASSSSAPPDAQVATEVLLKDQSRQPPMWEFGNTLSLLPFNVSTDDPFYGGASYLNATVPTLSPLLNCTNVENTNILVTPILDLEDGATQHQANMVIDFGIDHACQNYSENGGNSTGVFNITVSLGNTKTFWGQSIWPNWYPDEEISSWNLSCPWALLAYGSIDINNTIDDLSTVLCDVPKIQSAMTSYTLDVPSLQVSANSEASVVGSYTPQGNIPLILPSFLPDNSEGGVDDFDTVVALMLDLHGNDTSSLATPSAFVAAFDRVFTVAIAQYITYSTLVPLNDTSDIILNPPNNFTGAFENAYRARLVQSEVSTRILQGVLALMLVCIVVTYIDMDRSAFLPANPCSLAAKASLLASSKIITEGRIPPQASRMSDTQMEKTGVLATATLSLGWWDRSGNRTNVARPRKKRLAEGLETEPTEEEGLWYGIDCED